MIIFYQQIPKVEALDDKLSSVNVIESSGRYLTLTKFGKLEELSEAEKKIKEENDIRLLINLTMF